VLCQARSCDAAKTWPRSPGRLIAALTSRTPTADQDQVNGPHWPHRGRSSSAPSMLLQDLISRSVPGGLPHRHDSKFVGPYPGQTGLAAQRFQNNPTKDSVAYRNSSTRKSPRPHTASPACIQGVHAQPQPSAAKSREYRSTMSRSLPMCVISTDHVKGLNTRLTILAPFVVPMREEIQQDGPTPTRTSPAAKWQESRNGDFC
jgi:hypothetical protein